MMNKNIDPSKEDIKSICRFFSIGRLQHYEKEKDIAVPHANFFVFAITTHGKYALKFYPTNTAGTISAEYAVNHLLADHRFPTPIMHAGLNGQPFMTSNDRLVTCFSYIDGLPAWKHIKQRNIIRQINTALLSLKNILSANGHIPFLKEASLTITINDLLKTSRALDTYDQKETIHASLLDACRVYQRHQSLFTRQWLHNQPSLPNFLIYKKTVYTLDLEHVQEDYTLSDLASLVISCLSFDVPLKTIKTIVEDYFIQHKTPAEHSLVLNTLVKTGLIGIYLKLVQREKSVKPLAASSHTHQFDLSTCKESITDALKKMDDILNLVV